MADSNASRDPEYTKRYRMAVTAAVKQLQDNHRSEWRNLLAQAKRDVKLNVKT